MLSAASTIDVSPGQFQWPPEGLTRAPYRLFTDRDVYQLEQKRIFRGRSWSFLGLDVEVPDLGDCKATSVDETSVIVTRDKEGNIHALVSRSAAVYDALYLICAAIKKTGGNTNGDALIAAMKGTAWESPRGPVSIDPEPVRWCRTYLQCRVREIRSR
jgi:hypothetical protein